MNISNDIDSYLRKRKVTADTKITLALLIELLAGFSKEKPDNSDGWISIEDRLPDYKADPRPVLCLHNNGNIEVSYHLNHCTHWQPLPLPPKK